MGRPSKLSKKTEYRVVRSFPYFGKDGKGKKSVVIGPGEPLPKLESALIENLLNEGRICAVDMYGENIPNNKLEVLSAEEVERLFDGKGAQAVLSILATASFDADTLGRMLLAAEKFRMPDLVVQAIEAKM